ncbi:MAG: U32 family peptidase [Eubacteriales bacterium]
MKKLPELLAPAGSPEALSAAIRAGADAVYMGASGFNARIGAANFTPESLKYEIARAHEAGVRIYLTLNTLVYDREIPEMLGTAEAAYLAGADALIVADLGVASLLRRTFPDLPLHASTQMSGHNLDAARELHKLGFERMVIVRETSRENMELICRQSPIEIEAFVHGALCVCHSGQCLFSSIVGGRSGNRGLCAQPCRLPYTGERGSRSYPLSLKDLSLAEHLPELIDMGVSSLKVEGRMKPPEYVGGVISIWRRLLDECRGATPEEMRRLAEIFSRQGFTDGYYVGKIDNTMLGVRTESDKARSASRKKPDDCKTERAPIPEYTARAYRASDYVPKKPSGRRGKPIVNYAVFCDPSQLTPRAAKFFDICFLPSDKFRKGARGVALPPVIPDSELPRVRRELERAVALGATEVLLGNLGHIALAREFGLTMHGDLRLNVTNGETAAALEELGFEDFILSPELTLPRLRDISGRSFVTVYGRLPLMVTEKCVGKEIGGCEKCNGGKTELVDRMGVRFPVMRVPEHRSLIVNSLPTYVLDRPRDLCDGFITRRHYFFTVETPREVDAVLAAAQSGAPIPGGKCRRLPQPQKKGK